jgi:hypothetical protein
MLETHLPKRYCVNKAFVVDAEGGLSQEIDIVIYDRQYTPILYNHSGQIFIPAESVYAVLEVKQSFNKYNFEYAGAKAASVRKLKRTSAVIPHAGGRYEPRALTPIFGGILAYKCDWTPPFGDSFAEALKERAADERLDFGCAISSGAFDVEYPADNDMNIKQADSEVALISFFLNLLQRLQSIGTVPAIDYEQYKNHLDRA